MKYPQQETWKPVDRRRTIRERRQALAVQTTEHCILTGERASASAAAGVVLAVMSSDAEHLLDVRLYRRLGQATSW